MRLTTGEVRDQITRKYRKLEHNNKKERRQITDYRHYFKCRFSVLTMQI